MKKISFLYISICILIFLNPAFAINYFCVDAEYGGNFNPEDKPKVNQCGYLKDYTLSYNSCISAEKESLYWYNLGLTAYKKGKCYPYQIKTYKYASASCKAEFIARENANSLSITTLNGNNADAEKCIKLLENELKKEYPTLNMLNH